MKGLSKVKGLFVGVYHLEADPLKIGGVIRAYGIGQVIYTLGRLIKDKPRNIQDPYRHLETVCGRMAARYRKATAGRMMKSAPNMGYRPAQTSGSVRNNLKKTYSRGRNR